MSSGFVSGGTTDEPIERDEEWLKAQQELEATRRRKEEESRQDGGKTLYEVLQANKAAKQEAFEESIRLKNQFRNLDEDEVEFLDSVLESTRAKEEAVKKETAEQLDLFRRQQEEADKASLGEGGDLSDPNATGKTGGLPAIESEWAVNAKKRKRAKEKEGLKGIKLRRSSTSETPQVSTTPDKPADSSTPSVVSKEPNAVFEPPIGKDVDSIKSTSPSESQITTSLETSVIQSKGKKEALPSLGLAGYSSDED